MVYSDEMSKGRVNSFRMTGAPAARFEDSGTAI
jgi:hypothetical protein